MAVTTSLAAWFFMFDLEQFDPRRGACSDDVMSNVMNDITKGIIAGAAATAPMTVAMTTMHRALPPKDRYPLPPSLITENIEVKAGVVEHIDRKQHRALTMANHFGYGALCGALYVSVVGKRANVGNGVLFGLGVWSASYLGLLPALNLLSPATKIPKRRNALMIVAHVVWGGALGLVAKWLR